MATPCPVCSGKGIIACRKCFGTGKMDHPAGYGETVCEVCEGEREVECERCEGTGEQVAT